MKDFEGRTAIVTGASRGIGLAASVALARSGANVVLTSRYEEAAHEAAESISEGVAVGFAAHAVDEAAGKACIDFTMDTFGRVDILVNNAGTNPAFGPVLEQGRARFSKTMDVNLWAPILWSNLVWDAWMKDNGGVIINTASIGGYIVGPDLGVYHVSKAAMIHLTRQLALELAPQVRVNAVAPGIVRTRLAEALWKERETSVARATPLARIGEPEDIGEAVAFLASDRASWITGETLVIDGGQMLLQAIENGSA